MSSLSERQYVDVCVNLLNSQFRKDLPAVLQRAYAAGVTDIAVTATDLTTASQAVTLCETAAQQLPEDIPSCITTAGIHPHDATIAPGEDSLPVDWTEQLRQIAQAPCVRAIGETGLDFFRNFVPQDQQRQVFEAQIEIAQSLNKPLFVHDRDTGGAVFSTLNAAGLLPPVMVHCFTGSEDDLLAYVDAGYYIGLTGWIADSKRGADLRRIAHLIPDEQLVIETDAPFLRPQNMPDDYHLQLGLSARDKRRNEPGFIEFVAAAAAEARGQEVDHVAATTSSNARRFFAID